MPAVDHRLPDAVDDEAEGVVLRDPARRIEHQVGWEEGVGEEQDHEDQWEDPLDHAGTVGAERDRRADRSEGERRRRGEDDDPDRRRHSLFELGPEDQPQDDEVNRDQSPEGGRRRQPPKHHGVARDRRGEQPVREPHLDVDREGDRPRVPGEHHRLDDRAGEHEGEEVVDRREAWEVDRPPRPGGLDRQEGGGEGDQRRQQLGAPKRLPDGPRSECGDHAAVRRQTIDHGWTASVSSVSWAPSRCCPVFWTKTSSRVGWTRSSDSTSSPT